MPNKAPLIIDNGIRNNELFNINEVRHLAINFAITCLKGSTLNFDEWYNNISPNWRTIANKK